MGLRMITLVSENKPIVFGANGQPISLEYLDPGLVMGAPYIDRHVMRVHLNITTPGGNGSLSRIWRQIIQRFQFKDHQGPRYDVTGADWRVFQKYCYGWRYTDGPNIAAGQTVDVVFYMRLPLGPPNLVKPTDCRIPLRLFREGGQQIVTWAGSGATAVLGAVGSTSFTVNSGDYEYHTRIIDELKPSDKMRMEVMDYPIDQVRKLYPIGLGAGSLYTALQYNGPTNENSGTPWVSPQQVSSRTLEINNFFADHQQDEYAEHNITQQADSAATIASEDPVNLGNVIPFVNPTEYQSAVELPDVAGFDWQTTLALGQIPADAQMIIAAFVDRTDSATRKTFCGCDSKPTPQPNAIKTADGKVVAIADLPPDSMFRRLARRLPTVFSPSVARGAASRK